MNEKFQYGFVGAAFAVLLIVLLWKTAPSTPITVAAAPAQPDPNAINPVGADFLVYNQPLNYPPPLSFMTLPTTSVATPGPALNTGCNSCQ
jgi:hypothetical protein